jgi:superfamily II RNA helicase
MEPIQSWINGESMASICTKYEMHEGNFIRALHKLSNIMDEWEGLATYCQDTVMIEKITGMRGRIIRDIAVSDSLYLTL